MEPQPSLTNSAALTTEAVVTLPPYSPSHNRRALLQWLKEQGDKNKDTELDENMSDKEEGEEEMEGEEEEYTVSYDTEIQDLSETETTISAFSTEDEISYKALEECREIVERANVFNRHYTMFIDRWNGLM